MTIETLSLSAIETASRNPRRKFDRQAIEGLASSIKTDGLLQNLVVRPVEGKRKRFAIVSGERRFRAMKLLEQRGELPEGFTVSVEIRAKLSKDDTLRIATVENLQRQNLSPLEETAALARLVHKGTTLDEVAAQTGLSETTIRRRLSLNGLCKEAKAALSCGEISLAQAEALTLADDEPQRSILEEIAQGHEWSGAEIRSVALDERPSVALAIFPREQYQGTITTDLFAEDETSYFDDAKQFFRLQREAVEQLAKHHGEGAAWVDVTENYRLPDWQYRTARKREKGGVVVNLAPCGRVDVLENVMRREIEEATAKATADNPAAPKKERAEYSAPLRRYVAHHKSMAVQEMLLASPRKAREIAALKSLTGLKRHACVEALADAQNPQGAYNVLEAQTRICAERLGLKPKRKQPVWEIFPPAVPDGEALYEAIKALSDHALEELQTLLAALSFGQDDCGALDTDGDSVFNRVARDLGADMKNHWRPERSFFEKRSREQLVMIAKQCGYADGRGGIAGYKKAELLAGLERHFTDAFAASEPTAAQVKARQWLPGAMLFPAVEPDMNG